MVPSEDSILTNLRRGALEYCVLASLREGEAYGFDIARRLVADGVLMGGEGTLYPLLARLRKAGLVSTSWQESDAGPPGTLYPLLARLRKAGLVSTSWQESDAGPPRRYYAITDDGARALDTFRRAWTSFRDAVDLTLEGPR